MSEQYRPTIDFPKTLTDVERGQRDAEWAAQMQYQLEVRELNAEQQGALPFADEHGRELGTVYVDPLSKQIVRIQTASLENVEGVAEKPNEHIYVTDEHGEITDERTTRGEARAAGDRYVVVSALLFHGRDMLVQRRSPDKKIDPDKLSASAHGVASEITSPDGMRVENIEMAGVINTALEINEELRHGDEPFDIRFWWAGKEDSLIDYARLQQLDDPNTIWMVPQGLFEDDGYPLGSADNKRTRMISAGFIFSKDKPRISHDEAEVSGTAWERPSALTKETDVTTDVDRCIDAMFERIYDVHGERIAEDAVIGDLEQLVGGNLGYRKYQWEDE